MIDYVLPIVLPVICGVMLLVLGVPQKRSNLLLLVSVAMTAVLGIDVLLLTKVSGVRLNLFELTHNVAISFALDRIGTIFYVLILVVWCLVMIFSFEYMKHEQNEKRYYGFFFIVLGVLTGLCFAGNLITFYAFFELLTLTSMPLVLHNQSHEAVMAGLKYLFYSFAGAYLALLGLYFLFQYGNTLDFTAGGVLNEQMAAQHQPLLLVLALLMILGFGVK
ncbi:MAG TPA: proton-conducting transporter membrane subunit, partial [Lachnospiraceae bacterium]|nr:proton-conducting transporter membrane subunit [Lachnospiraceae bacterium]